MIGRLVLIALALPLLGSCSPGGTSTNARPDPSASSPAPSATRVPHYVCIAHEGDLERQLKTSPPAGLGPDGAVSNFNNVHPGGTCVDGRSVESTSGLCIITAPDPSTGNPAVIEVESVSNGSCKRGTIVVPANNMICVLFSPGLDRPIPAFTYVSRVEAPQQPQNDCPGGWMFVNA